MSNNKSSAKHKEDSDKTRRHSHHHTKPYIRPSLPMQPWILNYLHTTSRRPKKTIKQIKLEYNQPGCQFYQIYHGRTGQYVQVLPTDGTIGVTGDKRSNSSK